MSRRRSFTRKATLNIAQRRTTVTVAPQSKPSTATAPAPSSRGGSTSRGRGGATTRGRGGATTRGRGGATTRGRGGATTRGRGGATTRGRGGAASRGRGGAASRGRGGATPRGRGRGGRGRGRGRGRGANAGGGRGVKRSRSPSASASSQEEESSGEEEEEDEETEASSEESSEDGASSEESSEDGASADGAPPQHASGVAAPPTTVQDVVVIDGFIVEEGDDPVQLTAAEILNDSDDEDIPVDDEMMKTARLELDDDRCDVCGGGESWDADQLICCDNCGVWVHQSCYGVAEVPLTRWLCDVCNRSGVKKLQPKCNLCGLGGVAAYKRSAMGSAWVHMTCATLVPGLKVDASRVARLSSLNRAEWSRTVCSLCPRKKQGACIQCAAPDCKVVFHPRCVTTARQTHLVDFQACLAYCPAHWRLCTTPAYRRLFRCRLKLAGKAVKQSTTFRCSLCGFRVGTARDLLDHGAVCPALTGQTRCVAVPPAPTPLPSPVTETGAGAGAPVSRPTPTSTHVHFSPAPPELVPRVRKTPVALLAVPQPVSAAAARQASGLPARVVFMPDQAAWEGKEAIDHWHTLHDKEGVVPLLAASGHSTFVLVTPGPCVSSLGHPSAPTGTGKRVPVANRSRHDSMVAHLEVLRQYTVQLRNLGMFPAFLSAFGPVTDPSRLTALDMEAVPAVRRGLTRSSLLAASSNYGLATDAFWRSVEFRALPEVFVLAGLVELFASLESALVTYIGCCEPVADVDVIVLPLGADRADCMPVADALAHSTSVVIDLRSVDIRGGGPDDGLPPTVLSTLANLSGDVPLQAVVGPTTDAAAVSKLAGFVPSPPAPAAGGGGGKRARRPPVAPLFAQVVAPLSSRPSGREPPNATYTDFDDAAAVLAAVAAHS